jgi:hypothetical protein
MNKLDIIEGNVIIADYLELRYYDDVFYIENHEYPSSDSFFDNATDCVYHKENLLYDCNWDWIEDVINKIKKVDPNFDYNTDDIKDTWKKVIDFIKLKNKK